VRGTEGYRAPELHTGDHVYSTKTDIWALGCVLHELAFGKQAFKGDWAASDYGRSNKKLEFPGMNDLCWHDSDKTALRTMLEQALAVKEYFRPSADLMVNIIESIIQDLGVASEDGLSELPTTPHTPAVSEVGPSASEITSDDERPETEPDSQSDGRPDEEGSISSSPSRQRTARCRQCHNTFPVQKDIIRHDKSWLGQIHDNSCSDCQPLFRTNAVTSTKVPFTDYRRWTHFDSRETRVTFLVGQNRRKESEDHHDCLNRGFSVDDSVIVPVKYT